MSKVSHNGSRNVVSPNNGQIMSSLLIFKYLMSHGKMKLTLKANVCSGLTLI